MSSSLLRSLRVGTRCMVVHRQAPVALVDAAASGAQPAPSHPVLPVPLAFRGPGQGFPKDPVPEHAGPIGAPAVGCMRAAARGAAVDGHHEGHVRAHGGAGFLLG